MNTLVTSRTNACPFVKEYTMKPIVRPEGAIPIKRPWKVPTLGPADKLVHYRILELKDDAIATICSDMTKLNDGMHTVRDVNVSSLGYKSVEVGDILAFRPSDVKFENPIISYRHHQRHQHPDHLVALEER